MSDRAQRAFRRSRVEETPAVDDAYSPSKDSSSELSELDSDTFSPEETDQVDIPQKRQSKRKAITRKPWRKRVRLTDQSATCDVDATVAQIGSSVTDLQALRVVPSSEIRNVNKWLEVLPTLSISETMVPSSLSLVKTDLTPLGDLPI
ncbi:unnamed protein product [Alternaria alternata]